MPFVRFDGWFIGRLHLVFFRFGFAEGNEEHPFPYFSLFTTFTEKSKGRVARGLCCLYRDWKQQYLPFEKNGLSAHQLHDAKKSILFAGSVASQKNHLSTLFKAGVRLFMELWDFLGISKGTILPNT